MVVTNKKLKIKVVHRTDVKRGDKVLWANLIVEVIDIIRRKGQISVLLGPPVDSATNYIFYYVVEEVESKYDPDFQ